MESRLSRSRVVAGVGGSVLYAAALVIVRGRPSLDRDAGIFLSVAARLLHGDRLYTGVWDNKPPLFFYGQAVSLAIAGWRGPFLLDVVWLSIATVSIWALLHAIGSSRWTRLTGAVVYPLVLTGAWYNAGYSELPALALAPAIAWLALRGRDLAAGCLLGVALSLRLDYGAILLAVIAVAIAVRADDRAGVRRRVGRITLGLLLFAVSLAAVLGARGELAGDVQTTWSQIGYPDRALAQMGEAPGIAGHLAIVRSAMAEDRLRPILFGLVAPGLLALAVTQWARSIRRPAAASASQADRALAIVFLATGAAAALTMAVSALWTHSLEPMALPAAFGACLLASTIESAALPVGLTSSALVVAVAACAVAFGGVSVPRRGSVSDASQSISAWWSRPRSVSADALNAATALDPARRLRYARLGQNTDDAHAAFIRPSLELACPVFHQYPFSTNLNDVLACLQDRRPELVLVGPFFTPEALPRASAWDAFVAAGERLLQARYVKAVTMPARGGTVEVWRRR